MTDDPTDYIILRGTHGFFKDERFIIDTGESVLIGRSSSCEVSLKRCERYLLTDPEDRKTSSGYQSVSREHLQLHFLSRTHITLQDLSSNGSFLDGQRFKKTVIKNLLEQPHEIQIGSSERLVIEWGAHSSDGLPRPPSSCNHPPFDEDGDTDATLPY
ncbi:MAG: FHA domain-containing protein [Planctomycetota bacterium]|jgi:pSer/pThr/pTyr-binding forkhead associated (FHA) protein|nr:FHA domain-containing protein [Planctomycetota bacterium]